MSLTQEQITRLGKLTSLRTGKDLSVDSVLDSFDSLSGTDTSHISEVSRSGNTTMMLREDIATNSGIADELLACSSQKKLAHQIVLGGIIA
jgi:Asp-tRNA(Asn)/Glu-tRNA(Gln) amidotransferase C subunit